jgi:hypothetical protein
VFTQAERGQEGATSASLQLTETLSIAVISGIGGALVSVGLSQHWGPATAILLFFVLTGAGTLLGVLVATRTLARTTELDTVHAARSAAQ